MIGQQFGRLIVIEKAGKGRDRHILWKCKCECGAEVIVQSNHLRSGHTRSCGCLQVEGVSKKNYKHGFSRRQKRFRLYKIWTDMKKRCNNPNHRAFEHYGARGIKVCQEWEDSFMNFFRDMAESHDTHLAKYGTRDTTLDRIENDSGYSPSNCRWATRKIQSQNRRRSAS